MDNLPVHKVAGVAEAIEAAGATLIYLPKYSPDLNPIELAFSKLKAHLRKAAEHTIHVAPDRSRCYRFQSAGMQKLLSPCGLRSNMTGIRSRCLSDRSFIEFLLTYLDNEHEILPQASDRT